MSKKIILTTEQSNKLYSHIINEMVINENAWESVKYGLSKLGRYKANGKIFGKGNTDKAAAAQIANIIDKKGNEVIQNLDSEIKSTNPEFPNNKSGSQFLNTILSIAVVYDSIIGVTTSQDPQTYLPPDAANGVINDLRSYVKKFLDVDLTAAYSVVDEIEGNSINLTQDELLALDEAFNLSELEDSAAGVRKHLQNKRTDNDGEDFDSTRMNTLKSNRLPLTLMGVGASLGAFSWLVNTDWFKYLFDEVSTVKSTGQIDDIVNSKTDIFGTIKPSQGMTQLLNELNNAGLTPNSTPEQFLGAVKDIGGGDLNAGIEALTAQGGIFTNPEAAHKVLNEIAANPHGHGDTLEQIFQDKMAGTGRVMGDTLVTVTGGELKSVIVKILTDSIPKIITKTAIKTGAGYAVAKGLGSVLGPIGVGLLAAGAIVKLLRMKGQKQSRAKTLNDLYQSIRNIQGGVGIVEPEGEVLQQNATNGMTLAPNQGDNQDVSGEVSRETGGNDDLYNSLRNLFQLIVNNRKMLGTRSSDNVGTSMASDNRRMRAGDKYSYNGNPVTILKPDAGVPNRTLVKYPNNTKTAVDTDKLKRLNESLITEVKYIKDKRLFQFLTKNLSFDKLKSFEDLIYRIEIIRNKIRKLDTSKDNVLAGFVTKFKSNPIIATDFIKMFNISSENPQAVNSLKAFIDDIFISIYSGNFKYSNAVDKMAKLGSGNINKLEEAYASDKNFQKDAQDRRMFKKNLLTFLGDSIGLFQYLYKLKNQSVKK